MAMLEDAFAYMAEVKIDCNSTTILYQFGDGELTLDAEVSRTMFEMDDGSGVVDSVETRDFLVLPADLEGHEPKRGDKIIETLAGKAYTRTVASPTGKKVWQHDGFRGFIRIHTWDRQEE